MSDDTTDDTTGRGWSHADIEELLGAYAIDAVEPDEAEVVASHLPTCPRCAAEVADHLEVVALLANDGAAAPEGVWGRILEELEEEAPTLLLPSERQGEASRPEAGNGTDAPVRTLTGRRRLLDRGPNRRWLPAAAAAAAVVLVLGLITGVTLTSNDGRVDLDDVTQHDLATRALSDPQARQVTMQSPDGTLSAPVAIEPDGTSYLLGTTLPELDPSETYQLWAIAADRVISLGVLGPTPGVVPFHVDETVQGLAITREVAGGVVSSEQQALLVVQLS